jgi:glyoxylase I family protein
MTVPFSLTRIHHVAYRCHDAAATVAFYQRVLGMTFKIAFAENQVPSTKEPHPYMHVFLEVGMGNVLAFFELPTQPPMGRDTHTPAWVQHIAFEVDSRETLQRAAAHIRDCGVEVLGPVDHGLFESIYFFDPNGHRLELAVNTGSAALQQRAESIAPEMLAEWRETRRAPAIGAFLHAKEFES